MKIIKVVYNSDTAFIVDVVSEFSEIVIVELYDTNHHKEKKSARVLQTAYGSKNVPLVVLEDENQEGYAAIWSESNPNWREEIIKYLKYI